MHAQCASRPTSNVSRPDAFLASKLPSTADATHEPVPDTASEKLIRYNWIEGVERLEYYKPGGYHPIMIGDLLHGRYRIVDKLGYGGYSTIWLAHDDRQNRFVAAKVGVSRSSRLGRESKILHELSSLSRTAMDNDIIPKIQDEFELQGPNGTHPCYILAPTQSNLKESSFSCLFSLPVARALSAKLALAILFVHSRGFVHGDLHLRNVLIGLPTPLDNMSIAQFREKWPGPMSEPITRVDGKPLPPNIPSQAVGGIALDKGKEAEKFEVADAHRLLLADFGEAFSPLREQRLGKYCNAYLAIRPPEALFEPNAPLSYPSDIWTLAIAIWEILGMKIIFSDWTSRDEVIAQQLEVLGWDHFPSAWRDLWERPVTDAEDNSTAEENYHIPRQLTGVTREPWPPLEDAFEQFVQKWRREEEKTCGGAFGEEETRAILDLIRGMMRFRPQERLTINEVLHSEWMVKWALPALER
ncbi:hypothetical protein E4U21_002094 [Claviceps maximensis]|nr:hypothetical protein E4U21_002094 [Claviceps maximensis]